MINTIKYEDDLITILHKDDQISSMKAETFKDTVKTKAKEAALAELIQIKSKHSKMEGILYNQLQLQEYLKHPLFDTESATMLLALSRTVRGIKNDFRGTHSDTDCPLGCGSIDTLQNILTCPVLQNYFTSQNITQNKVQYNDIFSNNIVKQKQVTHMFIQLMGIREKLVMNHPD